MFESVSTAPPDAILGLTEAFQNDPNPAKINLSVGVYQAEDGSTPVLDVVREAETRLVTYPEAKTYLPISGSPAYTAAVQNLLLGGDSDLIASQRVFTAQTPGGTGALRIAADFLRANFPKTTVWLSEPTWPNHPSIFSASGLPIQTYPYFDAVSGGIDYEAMMRSIGTIPAGDVILLHGCCHNPTGADPSPSQWRALIQLIHDRNLLPLVDFAYQGFAAGIGEDAVPIHTLAGSGIDLIVCSSFSKNFGLYRERVGALTMVTATRSITDAVMSQVKRSIRSSYSNPPAHGGTIVATVLADPDLHQRWEEEVASMRDRINGTRNLLAEKLRAYQVPGDFSFLARQRGMFSFTGLTPDQVDRLRDRYSIYVVRSGRINVAGINSQNINRLCTAMKDVIEA